MSLILGNMAELLFDQAAAQPDKLAIVIPHDLKRVLGVGMRPTLSPRSTFSHEPLMAGLRAQHLGWAQTEFSFFFPFPASSMPSARPSTPSEPSRCLSIPAWEPSASVKPSIRHHLRRSSASKHF